MAQCQACGMQNVASQVSSVSSRSFAFLGSCIQAPRGREVCPQGSALRIDCGVEFDPLRAPSKKKKVEEAPHKKRVPVRLPGAGQVPAYGKQLEVHKSPPGLGQFKPPELGPPGHYTATQEGPVSTDDLINKIKERCGTWQERSAAITELQRLGFRMEELYEVAFVAGTTQTTMVVARQVYESMVQAECPPEVLSWFDEFKVDVLYALRTLSAQQRKLAAEYVSQNELEVEGAQELARAIKDHERRPQGREGFTPSPGDCLAFMLHRAAGETTNVEQRALFVQRGMSVAGSESAKQRFAEHL